MSTSLPETAPAPSPTPDFQEALVAVQEALAIPDGLTPAAKRKLVEDRFAAVRTLFHGDTYAGKSPEVLAHDVRRVRLKVAESIVRIIEPDLIKQAAKASGAIDLADFVTAAEGAEELGFDLETIATAMDAGELPVRHVALIRREDLYSWAEQLAARAADAEQLAAQAEADEHDTALPEPYPGASYRERAPRRGEACSCGRAATTVYLMDGRQVPYCGSQHQAAEHDTEMPGTDVTRTVEAPVYRYLVQPHGHPEVYRGAIRGEAVGAIVAWAILHDARPLRDEVGVWATRIETGGVKVGDPIEARNVTNLARVALAEAYQAKLDTELPGRDVTRVHDSHAVGDDQRFAGGVVGDPRFLRDKTPADLVAAWEYDANLAQSEDPNGAHETRGFARDLKEALTRVRIVPADAIVLERPTEEAVDALELHIDLTEEFIAAHAVNEDGGHEVLAHHICGSCSEIGADVYTPAQARTRAALFALAADEAERGQQ